MRPVPTGRVDGQRVGMLPYQQKSAESTDLNLVIGHGEGCMHELESVVCG